LPRLAHGVLARIKAGFDTVAQALSSLDIASNVYFEELATEPRTAVAVGEKYFLRAGNSLAATTVLVDRGSYTVVKVVATGARSGILDLLDFGASGSYARMIVERLAEAAGAGYEVLAEVDHMARGKSRLLSEEHQGPS